MKKRLLYIVHSLPFGGIEKVLQNICTFLDKEKYEIHIACLCGRGENAVNFENAGVSIKVFSGKSSLNPVYAVRNTLTFLKLALFIRRLNPHVVQCEMFYSGTLGRIGAWLSSTPVILYGIHNVYLWKGKIALLIEHYLAGITTRLICPSHTVARAASDSAHIPLSKFSIIPNGINLSPITKTETSEFFRAGKKANDTGEKLVLCFCGRMVPKKRPEFVVSILREFIKRKINCHLIMVGNGPLLSELKESTKDLKDYITFTGSLEDPSSIIRNCQIVVIPSDREGFCIVTGEALIQKTPVLMMKLPVLKECWDFCPDLWFLNSHSPSVWGDRVLEILSKENREILDGQLNKARKAILTKYTVKEMCNKYETLYSRKNEALIKGKDVILQGK
jgi:glycosyltransferase involved in cell wall biosynthesis